MANNQDALDVVAGIRINGATHEALKKADIASKLIDEYGIDRVRRLSPKSKLEYFEAAYAASQATDEYLPPETETQGPRGPVLPQEPQGKGLGIAPPMAMTPEQIDAAKVPSTFSEAKRYSFLSALSDGATQDNMNERVAAAQEEISQAGDVPSRIRAKDNNVLDSIKNVEDQIQAGVTDMDILQKSLAYIEQERLKDDQYALEKRAIDRQMEFATNNPAWADLLLDQPLALQQLADRRKKEQVIQTWFEKTMRENRGDKWATTEFAGDTVEFLQSLVGGDLLSGWLTYGNDAQNLKTDAFDIMSLPIDKIPGALDDYYKNTALRGLIDDEELALERMQAGFGEQEKIDSVQFWHNVDLAGLVAAIGTPFAKGGLKPWSKTRASTGEAQAVAAEANQILRTGTAEGTSFSTADEALEATLHMAGNDTNLGTLVDDIATAERVASSEVAEEMAENVLPSNMLKELLTVDAMLAEIKNLTEGDRLLANELATAIDNKTQQLGKIINRDRITATDVRYDAEKGTYEFDVLLGKQDGSGYKNEGAARTFMASTGFQNGELVKTDLGFFVKQTHSVAESLADNGLTNFKPIGVVRRFLQEPKAWVDKVVGNLGTIAGQNEVRATKIIRKTYDKYIRSLPKKDFKELLEILNTGLKEDRRSWLTHDELSTMFRQRFDKSPTESQIIAYETYRKISDVAHWLDNRAIYKEKAAKGLETVTFGVNNPITFDAHVFTTLGKVRIPTNARVFLTSNNQFVKASDIDLTKKLDEGYVLVRPDDPSVLTEAFGDGVSYILTKRTSGIEIKPLRYDQLPNVQGGRIEYKNKFFIGQQTSGVLEDGTHYLNKPRMFYTASTEAQAIAHARKVTEANRALKAYLDGEKKRGAKRAGRMTKAEANSIILANTGKGLNEWLEYVTTREWDLSVEFKVKKDREQFPIDADKYDAMRMYNPEAFEAQVGYRTPGRLGSRADSRLEDISGGESEIYDAFGALTRNVDRAISNGTYTDFKINAINRFNTTFRKYIANADSLTPYEVVTKGEIDLNSIPREDRFGIYNSIKGHQFYIKSLLKVKGTVDSMVEHRMDKLASWIEKADTKVTTNIAAKLHEGIITPAAFLRNLNFNLNLGIYNPAQYLTQANSIIVAIALSPRHGLSAFKEAGMMRYALIGDDSKLTNYITKTMAGEGIEEASDLSKSVDQFKRLGLNDFGSNLAMIDAQNTIGATSNRTMSNVSRALEHSRFFFNEGERASRLTAYGIARRTFADRFPDKDIWGREADNWIRVETDRLLLSPNADNNALINRGIGGIPTQFWSYMMKMSSAIFTGSGGRYTGAERARLAAAQILAYGAAGMPMLDHMITSYEKSTGTVLDPNVAKLIHNGLIDSIIFVASGGEADTNFSASNGLGGWWESLLKNIGEQPLIATLAGPVGSNLWGGWEVVNQTAKVYGTFINPTPESVTMPALAGLASVVKSMSKTSQAIIAWNTGIWYDRHGRAVGGASKKEAVLSLFGFQPQMIEDAFTMYKDDEAARENFVKEMVPIMQQLNERYYDAQTQKERDHIQGIINAYGTMISEAGWSRDLSRIVYNYSSNETFVEKQRQQLYKQRLSGKEGGNNNLLPLEMRREIVKGARE